MDQRRHSSCDAIDPMLTPYVDGEVAVESRAAVERHLAACPPCADRLAAERAARDAIRSCRPALAVHAPAGLAVRCRPAAGKRRGPAWRWVPLSLAASLLLAVLGAAVFSVNNPAEVLAAEIAIDHLKCFKLQDTSATADPGEVAREWRRDHGWSIPVVPGMPLDDIKLVGVRRCLTTSGQVAHLMYTAHGVPLSVYVWRGPSGAPGDLEVMGQRAVIWASGGRTFAVVGTEPSDVIARVCEHVRRAAE